MPPERSEPKRVITPRGLALLRPCGRGTGPFPRPGELKTCLRQAGGHNTRPAAGKDASATKEKAGGVTLRYAQGKPLEAEGKPFEAQGKKPPLQNNSRRVGGGLEIAPGAPVGDGGVVGVR